MAQAAYRIEETRQPHRRPELRVVQGGQRRRQQWKETLRAARNVLVTALLLSLIACVVLSKAQSTELNARLESKQRELLELESTYGYLTSSMENITSRANVETYAQEQLGLVLADPSQYTYVELQNECLAKKVDSGGMRVFLGFQTAALNLLGNLES